MSNSTDVLVAILYHVGGLLFWPVWRIVSGTDRKALSRILLNIFWITLVVLLAIGALTAIIYRFQLLNYHWMPIFILVPAVNLVSLVFSVNAAMRFDKSSM